MSTQLSPFVEVREGALPLRLFQEDQPPWRKIVELSDGTFWETPDRMIGFSDVMRVTKPVSPSVPMRLCAHFFNYTPDEL